MSVVNKESDDLICKHFHSHGHHGLKDVSILIDKVNAKDYLLATSLASNGQWAMGISAPILETGWA